MGLFASRPQEPFEWAGIPSEPLRDRTEAEYLDEPPTDPFAITTSPVGNSITIEVVPVPPQDSTPAADDDEPDGSDPAD
ncbi:hypothetical protein GCM10022240_13100 [Microbacterium kribbense]|uniref:Uncharacterized protein n=1 Tax=Microbacterium kribbense TaxID=433645 RepID=A0ABP7GE53_9MICO